MIASLQGKISLKNEKFVILEVAGVGYKVFCASNTLNKLNGDKEIKLFTYLHLREEAVELYGFLTFQELELFETLNEISGIGPKTAMNLTSVGSLAKLKEVIEKGQLPKEIKGIGQKRAQKILLELTGKIQAIAKPQESTAEADESLDALISLGFPRQKVKEALSKVPVGISDSEERIKEALKFLGKT